MKTTENISLGGYAFTIDLDAYEQLNTYLNEIRTAFNTDPNADEIMADIEERISELIKEQADTGSVISSRMIQEVIGRIGTPKELADEGPETGTETHETDKEAQAKKPERKRWRDRRLYRDVGHKVLGGVCSGIAAYFGIDKVLVRLIFIILVIIGLFGIVTGPYVLIAFLVYVCLWISMPAARTQEQKELMCGGRKKSND